MPRAAKVFLPILLFPALAGAAVVALTDETVLAVAPDSEYRLGRPAVAARGSGFVVAWDSSFSRYSGSNLIDWGAGVEARTITAGGQPDGPALSLVPEAHKVDLTLGALAGDASGRYAIVWAGSREGHPELRHWFRRFSATGAAASTRLLDEHRLIGFPLGFRGALALTPGGRALAFWQRPVASRPGLLGQLLPAAGPLPPRLQVTPQREFLALPELGTDGRGHAVLVYDRVGPSGFSALFVRHYDRDGQPTSGDLRLLPPGGTQAHPALDVHPGGRFVVAWQEGYERGPIRARLFDPPLRPVGPIFEVSPRGRRPLGVDVAMAADGTLFFTWKDTDLETNSPQVWARGFDSSGRPLGDAFRVDHDPELPGDFGFGATSSVAAGADGTFLVTWVFLEPETFIQSVYCRLYGVTGPAAP